MGASQISSVGRWCFQETNGTDNDIHASLCICRPLLFELTFVG